MSEQVEGKRDGRMPTPFEVYIASFPCWLDGLGSDSDACRGGFTKHPECVQAAVCAWLKEQEGRDGRAVVFRPVLAARSAAEFLEASFKDRRCDSDGVSCCIRCNAVALARFVLKSLDDAVADRASEQREAPHG